MAKEWYLLKSEDYTSGFGSDDFEDYASDGLLAALNSSLGENVELYNYDLSNHKNIRAIIEGNAADSQENSVIRKILVPIGTCKSGMYIKYKDRFWLIAGLVDDNHFYEKGVLYLCNYLLTWMDSAKRIHQRWCKIESAAQYNNGETSTHNYTIRSDQVMIYMPDDEHSLMLDDGIRFIIDKRCKIYERRMADGIEKDTSNPIAVYEITRVDSVLYDYQNSGYLGFIASQTEQRSDDGYYVVDGKGYWLCEHRTLSEIPDESSVLLESSFIECIAPEVIYGLDAAEFTAHFYDTFGNEVTGIHPIWEIRSDFTEYLDVSYVGNSILISADRGKLVNRSFELALRGNGYPETTAVVSIKAFI